VGIATESAGQEKAV